MSEVSLEAIELCAGAGGQALGLERAGFRHAALVEIDPDACTTLRRNRPEWHVVEADVRAWKPVGLQGTGLVAAGVPCPPFSIAGQRLGPDDERDLFPAALDVVRAVRPMAVLLENVRGLATSKFEAYRQALFFALEKLGYHAEGRLLHASDFGVPQLRPRYIIVAMLRPAWPFFSWPEPTGAKPSVGEALAELMASRGWPGAEPWAQQACGIAPTLVGGSKKHGGPDLGPTRAKQQWARLGIDGHGLANDCPGPEHAPDHRPRLTVRMAARIQGFPDDWLFAGGKTSAYRQVGNAFPPPVAEAVGTAIRDALVRSAIEGERQMRLLDAAAAGA